MRIGIDARLVTYRRGMGNYAYNLIAELAKQRTDAHFVLYTDHEGAAAHLPTSPRIVVRVLRPALYPIWEQLQLPRAVREDDLDVLHCLFNTAPIRPLHGRTRLVVTIHDVMFALPASLVPRRLTPYHELGRQYRKAVVRRVAHSAAHIITDSQCSRDDLARVFGISASRIAVIPLAADEDFRPLPANGDLQRVRERYGLDGPFVLAFGAGDPRKNTARIIEAFATLKRDTRAPLTMLLVGLTAGPEGEFLKLAASLGVAAHIRTVRFIPRSDLIQLYNAAEMFVYPSLYEGFGFPVLEAYACGTPVITSNSGSIAELVDDSALVVDPLDANAIGEAMRQVRSDAALRQRLKARGRLVAAEFSWPRAAACTFAIYESMMRGDSTGSLASPVDGG